MNSNSYFSIAWWAVCIAFFCGCRSSLHHEYGESEGYEARQSPAAFSVFRNLCESQGRSTTTLRSFSPKAKTKLQSIVWTPDSFPTHLPATYNWIDDWLSQGDRTLVYVGRDFSPMDEYWALCKEKLSQQEINGSQMIFAKEQQALEQSDLDRMRSTVRKQVATPWCLFDNTGAEHTRITQFDGPWSNDVEPDQTRVFLRSFPIPYQADPIKNTKKRFDTKSLDAPPTASNQDVPRFKWQVTDQHMLDIINSLSEEDLPEFEILLESSDGRPLVAELTRIRWGQSRILLVTNGSLLSNVSMIHKGNREIAKRLVDSLPKDKLAFLTGKFDPPIRTSDQTDRQKGFEMLTIWPLNVITLHVVFLGMLILLAVFPIFGRPKQLPQKSTRDFGQHVEAMGGLLYKSQDRFYALSTIADYFRHVKKDTTSPWANVEQGSQSEAQSPFGGSK
jgi:hypothetical protein